MVTESLRVACPVCQAANRVPAPRLGQNPRCGRCKEPLFAGHPVPLTPASFAAQVEGSGIPVVVDFWAPWCAPCRMMAPAFEEAARRIEPRARLAKVNTEEHPELASRMGIRAIPTLVVFRGGREAARQSGAMDPDTLRRWIESNI